MYHFLFIHCLVEGHPGCFLFVAIMIKATKNIVEQMSSWWAEPSSCIYLGVLQMGLKVG